MVGADGADGPGQIEDQIQPIESDRVSSTLSNVTGPMAAGTGRERSWAARGALRAMFS